MDGITEEGKVSLEAVDLVFDVRSGSHMVEDACQSQPKSYTPVAPRLDRFPWSLRSNPQRDNEPSLCWGRSPDRAVCYVRQLP
jgi:hypothetical protein